MENNFNFENIDTFDILLIYPGSIDNLDWNNLDYVNNIIKLDYYNIIKANSVNFIDILSENLELIKYRDKKNLVEVTTQIINESPNYIYEMLYVEDLNSTDNVFNSVASLLNTKEEKIYGNAILIKTFIPSLSKSIIMKNILVSDIKYILENRIKTNIVIYDELWRDESIYDLEKFAKSFFEDKYYKLEIPFLLHNINIWYEIDDFSTNKLLNICGTILDKPIYKCFWFTMITDEYRGSIYLDEVNKIIKLSYKLELPYSVKNEWNKDETDSYNRKVIYSKYKVLDLAYNELIENNIL